MAHPVPGALVALIVLAAALGAQSTLQVPGQFPTIADAQNAAQSGDTILVAPGTYMIGPFALVKNVKLVAAQGPSVTTLSGGGTQPVLLIGSGAWGATIEGFRITDGQGAPDLAGGISSLNSSYTIRNCEIIGNSPYIVSGGILFGPSGVPNTGGMEIYQGHVVIEDCRIASNGGGGIRLHNGASLALKRSRITNNSGGVPVSDFFASTSFAGWGGGLVASSGAVHIEDCHFEDNRGGGSRLIPAAAGAIDASAGGPPMTILRTRFIANEGGNASGPTQATPPLPNARGGAGAIESNRSLIIEDCLFARNKGGTGADGVSAAQTSLGPGGAGAIEVRGAASLQMRNCSCSGNQGGDPGDALGQAFGTPGAGFIRLVSSGGGFIEDSIVWANVDGNGASDLLGATGPSLSVTHSTIEGGHPGVGNDGNNPLFVFPASDDFRLQPSSPAIDNGSPSPMATAADDDLDGNPRVFYGGIDRGAYEYLAPSIGGSLIVGGEVERPFRVNGNARPRQIHGIGTPLTVEVSEPSTINGPFFALLLHPTPLALVDVIGFQGVIGDAALPLFSPDFVTAVNGTPAPAPNQLSSAGPAPYLLNTAAPPFPSTLSLQLMIESAPGTYHFSNTIQLDFQ